MEPPDRGGGRTGADHDPHRILHHGARGRGSVGRHLRPAGPHDGAGGDRHARPRQLHGRIGRALPGEIPRRHDEARRPLHHQRSLARHRPSARSDRGHPGLSQRRHRRAVRQHRACDRHRRTGHGPGRTIGVRGRDVHPHRQMLRRRQTERDVLRLHARRLPLAGRVGGRHLLLVRLQRRRGQTAGGDDGRVRNDQPDSAGDIHLRQFPPSHAGGDRAVAARHLPGRNLLRRV
ncbi:hypothetical protein GALL_490770 [mine drainage metagenome]|uniref:Uncharacterized protein n=1 Tax=mine drainage metagenome TaxID=410659 RepID=A0A1J5PDB7_9ZZZZ